MHTLEVGRKRILANAVETLHMPFMLFAASRPWAPPGSHLAPLDKSATLVRFQGFEKAESSVNGCLAVFSLTSLRNRSLMPCGASPAIVSFYS